MTRYPDKRNPISLALLWCCGIIALFSLPRESMGQNRIRFYWGGTTAQKWQGKVYLSDGDITNLRTLGVDRDSSCAGFLIEGRLELSKTVVSRFNGFDFEIRPSDESYLFVELQSESGKKFRKSYSVQEILSQPIRQNIDQKKNFFQLSRAPGDQIKIDLQSESAVFWTGQRFSPTVAISGTKFEPGTPYRSTYQLVRVSDQSVVWEQQFKHVTDENGLIQDIKRAAFKLPDQAGAFEFQVSFAPHKPTRPVSRSLKCHVEIVLVDANQNQAVGERERKLTTIDLTQMRQANRYDPNQILRRFQNQIYHNQKTTSVRIGDSTWSQLAVGGWHVIPVEIEKPGQPHFLEIKYPSQLEMALGISILQLASDQSIERLGADSGFVNAANNLSVEKPALHRITFWPQSKKVFIVLANRSPQSPATIGTMQVFQGPERLPASSINHSGRPFLAYYEQPFFADNFDSTKKYDPNSAQQLTDWTFFHQGGVRLADYLKSNGKSGAMLTVAADGSSIYPSQLLRPNPKYDNGIFSAAGKDIDRKDVLEMLFRIFDREKLALVPVIEFSAELPGLEQIKHMATAPASLVLKNPGGAVGNWNTPYSKPPYNVLCTEVQAEIKKVVDEVHERYSKHPSYRGVGIKLGPDTYTILPNHRWGFDRETVGRFLREEKIGAQSIDYRTAIERITRGDLGESWKRWRTAQLTQFYKQLANRVGQSKDQHQFYLAAVDLFRDPTIKTQLMPSLRWRSNYQLAMKHQGIDFKPLTQDPKIAFLSPRRVSTSESLSEQRVEFQFASNSKLGKHSTENASDGHLFVHRDQWVHYSQLEKTSPFDRNSESLIRFQPLLPTGAANRKKFAKALAHSDSQLLVEGGKVLSLGQEESLVNWHAVFTQLPKSRMRMLKATQASPVTVRYSKKQNQFYAVNSSPWKTRVAIKLKASGEFKAQSFGNQTFSKTVSNAEQTIAFDLEPFDIAGGRIDAKDYEILNYTTLLDNSIANQLQDRIKQIKQKLEKIDQVSPLTSIHNPDFEFSASGQPASWRFDTQKPRYLSLVSQSSYHGNQHLKMSSSGSVAWLRSNTIPPPPTGRLSLTVWLRVDDPKQQPPVRLAIQGRHHGKEYYRFANLGSLVQDGKSNQLTNQWKKYVVHFDDLPSQGLTDLQVGFDLMGKGKVELDHVQVFDRWFDKYDRKLLSQTIALASYQLVNQGDLNGCRQLLDSYWPRFIETYIGDTQPQNQLTFEEVTPVKPKTSLLQRVRDGMPNRIFRIR